MHAEPPHWLHEKSISKTVRHHFWLGLMGGSVIWGHSYGSSTIVRVIDKVMPCWAWVSPLIWCSYPQSHKMLLNQLMKCLDARIQCPRLESMYRYSTHSSSDWLKALMKKNRRVGTQIRPNLVRIWVSVPFEDQGTIFYHCFLKSHPLYGPNRGVWCRLFLTLWITLLTQETCCWQDLCRVDSYCFSVLL